MANANSQDRFRSVLLLIAVIATIIFNALSAAGLVNGVRPDAISAKYETFLTPAGYAFSIWTLIYIGLMAFAIYQMLPGNALKFRRIRTLVIASCVLNSAWIYFWHQERLGPCLVIITIFAALLIWIVYSLSTSETLVESLLTTGPFGLYAGWVTCAAFINLLIWLQYSGLVVVAATRTLAILLMVFAAGIAVLVRWRLKNFMFAVAVAWALTAIAVKQGGNTSLVVTAALGTVVALITAGSVVTRLKDASR